MNKLAGEELFGVGRRQTTELPTIAGAIQNRDLQAFQRKLLVTDLLEGRDTECEGGPEYRWLRQSFFLQQILDGLGPAADDCKGTFVDDAAVEGNTIHLVGLAVVADLH